MFQKYLIIASKKDKAGINITTQLSQFKENPLLSSMKDKPNFDFYLVDEEVVYTENLDLEKINKYDFIIFASKHQSEKKQKTLSIHAPGNWRDNDFGGEKEKISKASALFQKQLFEKLNSNVEKYEFKNYNVTLECTHHGPSIDKPCVFIEIGATDIEWNDRRAGFIIAKTIKETINEFKENPYNEVAIGIGGPHYCPNFNQIQLSSNIAIAHIIPKYSLPISKKIIEEAIEKTKEEVDFFVLDWKGLGNSEQRQEVIKILNEFHIQYRKTSEIKK
jgi:D-aminoacyl-tRNA deacylase